MIFPRPALPYLLRQNAQQRAHDARPGGPQGMTQGHCAAVDVDAPRSAVQRSASTALDAQKTRTSGFPGRCLKKNMAWLLIISMFTF